jgi:hypothetical protein
VSTPPPLDADSALAVLAAAGQRNAGVYATADGTQDLQAAQLGAAQPDQGGQP